MLIILREGEDNLKRREEVEGRKDYRREEGSDLQNTERDYKGFNTQGVKGRTAAARDGRGRFESSASLWGVIEG